MKKSFTSLLFAFVFAFSTHFASAQVWTTLATDPQGDGQTAGLLDATLHEYWYDSLTDSLWFRFTVAQISAANQGAFGVNVMVDIGGSGNVFQWWGFDNSSQYNRLLSVWVTGTPPSNYMGTIGIADALGVVIVDYTNLAANNISVFMDVGAKTITLGLKREDLIPASALGTSITTAGAVGSDQFWNDDIFDFTTGTMNISGPSGMSIDEETNDPNIAIYPNPASTHTSVVSYTNTFIEEVQVVDMTGRVAVRSSSTDVDVSSLTPGMYFMRVYGQNEELLSSAKFIKE